MRYENGDLGLILLLPVVSLLLLLAPPSGVRAETVGAGSSVAAEIDGPALFEQLKSLVGEWKGEWNGSAPTTVTYSLTGNGSALHEDYLIGDVTMATVYHLDGEVLMLTHYCNVGNQPRMQATSVSDDGKLIVFDFMDITNLPPGSGYSKRLEVSWIDEDRISLTYTDSPDGRLSSGELERVR